jgi:hypothetical protein
MNAPYAPPFAIAPAIVGLIADIAERVGHDTLAADPADPADPAVALRLRRIHRIGTRKGRSTPFIVFMRGVIRDALAAQATEQATEQITEQVTEQVQRLSMRMDDGVDSAKALMALLGLAHRPNVLDDSLQPARAGVLAGDDPPRHAQESQATLSSDVIGTPVNTGSRP